MTNAQKLGVLPTIMIGPIQLEGRVLLAPMSGISDLAMRRIARRFGAALVFSEMVAAETFLRGDAEASVRAEGEGLAPHAVQIVGCEAAALAETARRVVDAGAVLVDINMGCPSRRVSGALAGAALMRDLDSAERMIATVVEAVPVPVTVKMRLGWDETSLNAPELARRAERAGAQMATVHGRTRSQFYDGHADWASCSSGRRFGLDPGRRQRRLRDGARRTDNALSLRRRGGNDRARGGRRTLVGRRPVARTRLRRSGPGTFTRRASRSGARTFRLVSRQARLSRRTSPCTKASCGLRRSDRSGPDASSSARDQ